MLRLRFGSGAGAPCTNQPVPAATTWLVSRTTRLGEPSLPGIASRCCCACLGVTPLKGARAGKERMSTGGVPGGRDVFSLRWIRHRGDRFARGSQNGRVGLLLARQTWFSWWIDNLSISAADRMRKQKRRSCLIPCVFDPQDENHRTVSVQRSSRLFLSFVLFVQQPALSAPYRSPPSYSRQEMTFAIHSARYSCSRNNMGNDTVSPWRLTKP